MSPFILIPFAIGTAAFFAGLAVTLSQLGAPSRVPKVSPGLKKWDSATSWLMWGGWGVAMVCVFSIATACFPPHGLGLTLSPGVGAR